MEVGRQPGEGGPLFERFLPRPHEPGTNVLAIATPSKNGPARSCIQYCGMAEQLPLEPIG
jgi:hypothetical protein